MGAIGIRAVPTKGFLLELKKRIEILKEGHHLLSMKRDELTSRLMQLLERYKAIKREVMERAENIVTRFREIYAVLGPEKIDADASINRGTSDIDILPLSIMGITVPTVKVLREVSVRNLFGPVTREIIYDLVELFQELIRISEIESKIEILAIDLERTNRIVNALEKIIIPEMEKLAKYIEETLEEESLEEFLRIKLVRNIILARRGE